MQLYANSEFNVRCSMQYHGLLLLLSLYHNFQLLHVPTPYLIGVHSSFLDKLEENTDIWLVSLDEDKVSIRMYIF